jgi:hypothetical protein
MVRWLGGVRVSMRRSAPAASKGCPGARVRIMAQENYETPIHFATIFWALSLTIPLKDSIRSGLNPTFHDPVSNRPSDPRLHPL